ncbi:MAG: PDZ domain-containing protein, partial [Planctomycetota bacterium]
MNACIASLWRIPQERLFHARGRRLIACICLVFLGASPIAALAQQIRPAPADDAALIISAERLSQVFRNAAEKLRPSVVTINAMVERPVARGGFGFDGEVPEELFGLLPPGLREELFRRGRAAVPTPEDQRREKIRAGIGSGFIVSPDGYVLTNHHVIEQADELQVELHDGRTFRAEVIGADDKSDVAVLKIDATGLTAARLGDSSAVQVGDWVIAIGSPFGLNQTVTAGIISATHREADIISGGYEDFLQTDAAINPGNSGGPLVNLRGEVIGINTAINSRTGTNIGIGFAIPSNMAARVLEDLVTNGRVVRGFIGASLREVRPDEAENLQLPPGYARGVLIERVLQGGPADRSGLAPGDVVIGLGGRPVRSSEHFRNTVAMSRPGEEVLVDVLRDGQTRRIAIAVDELTEEKLDRLSGRRRIDA